ncbi:MAG: Ribonuclease HII [Chroococcidiopsis cubana SAG 39.79]|uniref:Ribonuclease HII n=1 Tax=Chroococcidiopsis cubana SAG 39.79 TaxID=388085 RepID=A0AB37UKZ3_9CYAN|nr:MULTISPECIES: ribonuclease HII [Chroococcidiopsis]PSB46421.1 ribonuclease HII [Cyanosarcina cf. burmensis CCALA 770]MDZ4875870.1 Ribonuclease HII [Chroococcidiopsis cubana SAG 39.79]PSB61149.1 ribonuclease HII [Chroococcidiopsis cubana CCALA 043]RUT12045.1 ribonuclease HII [Chroococcidiopsis cubana SAG 39.79]URD49154.1 ribonuclease HII [Chroococcidiopsis sp. CCNUC1]
MPESSSIQKLKSKVQKSKIQNGITQDFDSGLSDRYSILIAGVDEVGRGALFGPVVAAAVVLPPSALKELVAAQIRDSKKLSRDRRLKLAAHICQVALDWRIGFATSAEIDRINILQASLLAMKRAVLKLKIQPELCLVDGRQPIKDLLIPQQAIVKGDEQSLAIASASIVAKVWRDALITRLAVKYPQYDLVTNKGYGTQRHIEGLQQHGPCRLHRLTFRPCQLKKVGSREQGNRGAEEQFTH